MLRLAFQGQVHAKSFDDVTKVLNTKTIELGVGILRSLSDDYANGVFLDARILIEAEVFSDFLEQAEELFRKRYFQPAAVVAGILREIVFKGELDLPEGVMEKIGRSKSRTDY